MDAIEDEEVLDERPPSPYEVLREISQEAFKLAGEAINNARPRRPLHRRCHSELLHNRDNGFLNNIVQKFERTQSQELNFNYELLANQKRQWYQIHSKSQVWLNFYISYLIFIVTWGSQ